jgi:hypothetical protein
MVKIDSTNGSKVRCGHNSHGKDNAPRATFKVYFTEDKFAVYCDAHTFAIVAKNPGWTSIARLPL